MLDAVIYEMLSALAVADKKNGDLIFHFYPKGNDPELSLALPAGAVGHFIVQVAAAHQEIALTPHEDVGAFAPLELTGVRPFQTEEGTAVLMLQFANSLELAVTLTKEMAGALSSEAEHIHDSSGPSPKRH